MFKKKEVILYDRFEVIFLFHISMVSVCWLYLADVVEAGLFP